MSCKHFWVEIFPLRFQCKNCGIIKDLYKEHKPTIEDKEFEEWAKQ